MKLFFLLCLVCSSFLLRAQTTITLDNSLGDDSLKGSTDTLWYYFNGKPGSTFDIQMYLPKTGTTASSNLKWGLFGSLNSFTGVRNTYNQRSTTIQVATAFTDTTSTVALNGSMMFPKYALYISGTTTGSTYFLPVVYMLFYPTRVKPN
jgi:hypothetical protein